MYRGTTPTLPITIKNIDLSGAKLFLTIQGLGSQQITLKTPDDFEVTFDGTNTVGEVILTQSQTLAMKATQHSAQIRWITEDGTAGATKERMISVKDVLLKGVIQYE